MKERNIDAATSNKEELAEREGSLKTGSLSEALHHCLDSLKEHTVGAVDKVNQLGIPLHTVEGIGWLLHFISPHLVGNLAQLVYGLSNGRPKGPVASFSLRSLLKFSSWLRHRTEIDDHIALRMQSKANLFREHVRTGFGLLDSSTISDPNASIDLDLPE